MNHVIPTVFARSALEFKRRFFTLVKIAPAVQIDFMDGIFVPAMSMPFSVVPDLHAFKVKFEAHLMVANPEKWIEKIAEKGFKKIIVHIETIQTTERGLDLFHRIRTAKAEPMLAINPETSMERLDPFLKNINAILVMGARPGEEHQELTPNTARRAATLKKRGICVQVDGGVNADSVGRLAAAGANAVNSGSFVSDAAEPLGALRLLEKKFKEGRERGC